MERLYHLICVNERTGIEHQLTLYPMPHAQCCTMKSKITEYSWRRIYLREHSK